MTFPVEGQKWFKTSITPEAAQGGSSAATTAGWSISRGLQHRHWVSDGVMNHFFHFREG
jgi:hypothetical protein